MKIGKKSYGSSNDKTRCRILYPFIDECVKLAKRYSADCYIFTSYIGCKQFGTIPQILREVLRDEVGIPMLLIDLYVGDAQFVSEKIIREKIKLFAQTLMKTFILLSRYELKK